MNNITADYYNLLGLPENASPEDIKKSFRVLALRFHPDKNPGDRESEEKFKNISKAYEILSDPQKRMIYDRSGSDNFHNMFNARGGMGCAGKRGCCGRGRRWNSSDSAAHEILITREEAIAGAEVSVAIDNMGRREIHKINLPEQVGNGTVLRCSNSSMGTDFFIRVLYSD